MENTNTSSGKENNTEKKATAQAIRQWHETGLTTIVLPGRELDFAKRNTPQLLQLLKQVGRTGLPAGRIYEGHINALLLIHLFAGEEQKHRWYQDAGNGCLFGVWNTQANDGVAITANEDVFRLRGKKTFASGAGTVNRALITGSLAAGDRKTWQMCIVNTDKLANNAIDYDSWHPMGMASSDSYIVNFEGYESHSNDLLGKGDDYYKSPYFNAGAIRFCAVQLGGAEALFNETINYLKSLNRTDDPHQSARIAEMATAIASGQNWLRQAGICWDEWKDKEASSSRLIAFANMTRTAIESICLQVIERSCKCVGARGLMQPFSMERIVRDLQFYLRQPAPDAALRDIANYVIHSGQAIENLWNHDDDNH